MGDGGNSTNTLNTEAAKYMAEKVPVPEKGGPKTASSIRTKWSVTLRKLKALHNEIDFVVSGRASGFTYTNDHGFNIQPHQEHAWEGYIQQHPKVKPFKHVGWPLYDRMHEIIPAKTTGQYVFNASQATSASQATTTPSMSQSESQSVPNSNADSQATGEVEDPFSQPQETQEVQTMQANSPSVAVVVDEGVTVRVMHSAPNSTVVGSSGRGTPLSKRSSSDEFETPSTKRTKITGPEAILSEPSPERKKRAQGLLRESNGGIEDSDIFGEELTDVEKATLHILFSRDVTAADAYFSADETMHLQVARVLLASARI
ncbi:hypothetical protein K435DRAFT_807865 [Dendrothele bispora CBS 962.96]|uniref:Myb/SANT-like domain-containing protein n=1 Tax=Dendrothele bispora (strain CBS 962.96) TaxID=1314807 RepID=A0A4S8L3N1_DENBC|nr:hypothetical protein K435DRAFT_807865 [Dendrothele bispora CBS 962.96]